MDNLRPYLEESVDQVTYQPVIFDLSKEDDRTKLVDLFEANQVREVIDALPESVEDLFRIDFPFVAPGSPEFQATSQQYSQRYTGGKDLKECGLWAYYPWRQSLLHLPSKKDYYKLRTARNKFLITAEEQDKFYNSLVGVAGLSVGSSVVGALSLSGGAGHLRLADFDTLAITNLNRLPASACDLTRAKAIGCGRRLYEVNPFQELELFSEGITEENLDGFFQGDGKKLDLYIEEMDNIKLKIESRFKARELCIPVIMATDNGDNTIVDVERFDLEPDRPLFHGSVPEEKLRGLPHNPSLAEKVKLANRIVGPDVTPRMQMSLQMVGSKLPAWPQLGNAATLSGAAISYVARRILVGDDMPSGRYEMHFDEVFDPTYHTEAVQQQRAQQKADFIHGSQLIFGTD